ncbi:hypothetical protein BV22DRAFT_1135536 [Leucogyrophana mollusca]|uniref:Uncharacterized protein n=1 Tax=Leucogyrophana mollusca TaxID=85980 RepID=A0ACB8AWC9_9AGAM|nr:hypothetical protein BV22DRAFT_1135536 [Leucogyrophana mollusca]
MRTKFIIFRYCVDNWKAKALMGLHYPGWSDRPREVEPVSIKLESSSDSSSALSSKGKRPQSNSAIPSSRNHKKAKLEQREENIEPTATAVSISPPATQALSASNDEPIDIDDPRTYIDNYDKHEPPLPFVEQPPTAASTRVLKLVRALPDKVIVNSPCVSSDRPSHTVDALQVLANTAVTVVSTTRSHDKTTFLRQMAATLEKCSEALPTKSDDKAEGQQTGGSGSSLGVKKKRAAADRNSVMRPSSSATPRNLCAIDWCKQNKGGTTGDFTDYWDTLVKNNDPIFETCKTRSLLVKEAKKVAATAPSPIVVPIQPPIDAVP